MDPDQLAFIKVTKPSVYSKTCLKRQLKGRPKIGFQDLLSLNAAQKYCRMLQVEHSAILLTFIKLPFVIVSIFEWPLKTGFTVIYKVTIFYSKFRDTRVRVGQRSSLCLPRYPRKMDQV